MVLQNFALKEYNEKIHLVYGENDKYISEELRKEVIDVIKPKSQIVKILKDQNHSSWDFGLAQEVYKGGLAVVKSAFEE